jgi:DNA-binding NarL/FixJ family response regulator
MPDTTNLGDPVTPGELRALRAYLDAGSSKAAAYLLGVHNSTIKNHLQNIRTKLGVSTTAQCAFLLHDQLVDKAA